MKRLIIALGLVLLVAAFALPVMAHGPGWGRGGHMMGYGGGGPGYCSEYGGEYSEGLTEEKRVQLDKLAKQFYDETAQLRNELRFKASELDTLLNSAAPDAEKAKALQGEISALQAKMAQNRIDFELKTKKIIPEGSYSRGYGRGYHHMQGQGYGHKGYGPHRGYGRGGCRQ
ncbi:periplasmic heavy metal sensor [Thermodesulfobacteriota bacterium]